MSTSLLSRYTPLQRTSPHHHFCHPVTCRGDSLAQAQAQQSRDLPILVLAHHRDPLTPKPFRAHIVMHANPYIREPHTDTVRLLPRNRRSHVAVSRLIHGAQLVTYPKMSRLSLPGSRPSPPPVVATAPNQGASLPLRVGETGPRLTHLDCS